MKNKDIAEVSCSLELFCLGGGIYNLIEVVWRGYTHWSMFLVGGACFHIMGKIQNSPRVKRLVSRCALCSVAVTGVEFVSGCLFNLGFRMNVWDYSRMPFNLMGQVCALYAVLWGLLSIAAKPVYRLLRERLTAAVPSPRLQRAPLFWKDAQQS
ncbi:MAG: hypothetical protein HFJ80_02830 [Clostridiales bacterium]|nr:hypothetical protein [Clostridiales bacterium]